MRKISFFFIVFLSLFRLSAQELDCTVMLNSDKIPGSNKQIFNTLEKAIADFVNNRQWTNREYKFSERVKCNMTITLFERNKDHFTANIQVQSSRPIYNSTYDSPILNFKDKNFEFDYVEFEPLIYNKQTFTSNLVSVLSFYVYVVLGMDADTFQEKGGDTYFQIAQDIVSQAQQSGFKGWNPVDGNTSRFTLIDNLISPTFSNFRKAQYTYHLKGLDLMTSDENKAKEAIFQSINQLRILNSSRPNSLLLRAFMDAKADEISNIFSGGTSFSKAKSVKRLLQRMSPINSNKWDKIK
ncbi:MAG: DUF4835 family protein [Flavobacteriaceae bacterium]|nr:DUF4835 family protein [Flavobacteriaceae bacterium]